MRLFIRLFLICVVVLGSFSELAAQRRVTLKQAGQLRGTRSASGEEFQRVLPRPGEFVIFVQEKTTIYCDSAHFYKSRDVVEAFGRVRITEGDSITITARRLEYDGATSRAKLRNNVIFTKLATAKLYTDYLDYDRPKSEAFYYNGGRLVDSINVLVSNKGYYDVNTNLAAFKRNVKVTNPDYTMLSDSLQYNSRTKIIYFVTQTTVVNKDSSTFVYEGGQYNTITRTSDLREGAGESEDYTVTGIKYDLDAIRDLYKIRGNVVMKSKKENLIIYGQASDYYKAKGISKVYSNAYLAKVTDDQDTLFISADTLVSIDNSDPAKKRLLAYHNVKIYKKDMQGVADSVEYRAADSTIYFYNSPVLWTAGNQMTADSIRMLIENNSISKIFLVANSFVISQDTLVNYNQIKGRKMTAYFKKSKIDRVYVEGNGETIYFALDEKDYSLTGMNKSICSNILILFKDGKVHRLNFYVKPDATFTPPHELKNDQKKLKGFVWHGERRPVRSDVVKEQQPPPGVTPMLKTSPALAPKAQRKRL